MAWETGVQSQVESYQRLKKWYLILPCLTLSIIKYVSMVKWSKPRKGVVLSPPLWCCSYWKGSLYEPLTIAANFTFIYIYIYIYIYVCVRVCGCVCVCVSTYFLSKIKSLLKTNILRTCSWIPLITAEYFAILDFYSDKPRKKERMVKTKRWTFLKLAEMYYKQTKHCLILLNTVEK